MNDSSSSASPATRGAVSDVASGVASFAATGFCSLRQISLSEEWQEGKETKEKRKFTGRCPKRGEKKWLCGLDVGGGLPRYLVRGESVERVDMVQKQQGKR